MFSKFWREKNEPILSVNLDNSINQYICPWKALHSVQLHPENKVIYWENKTENRLFKTHAPRALIKKNNKSLEKETATHSSILAWEIP